MEKLKPEHHLNLEAALRFTADDLHHNSNGRLSANQQAQLRKLENMWLLGLIGVALPLGVIFVALTVDLLNERREFLEAMCLLVFFVYAFCWCAAHPFRKWKKYRQTQESRVRSVEGAVSLKIEKKGHSEPSYMISVGNQGFDVEHEIFLAFKNGDPYRIYYAPGSNTILSAESLASTQSSVVNFSRPQS